MRYTLLSFLLLVLADLCQAHGDLHEQIREVTRQIAKAPKDLELYQQRGELYVHHEQFKEAKRDLLRCKKGGINSQRLRFYLATCYYHLGKYRRSLTYLDKILTKEPGDVRSLRLTARILESRGDYYYAASHYEQVIQSSIRPIPENYTEAASAWQRAGKADSVIRVLKTGLSKLGPVPGLHEMLVKEYTSTGQFDEALNLQTEAVNRSQRKEFSLVRRAEIHMSKGDLNASQTDLLAAREAILQLPPRIQHNQSSKSLMKKIDTLIHSTHKSKLKIVF